jgi:hypothetical protein
VVQRRELACRSIPKPIGEAPYGLARGSLPRDPSCTAAGDLPWSSIASAVTWFGSSSSTCKLSPIEICNGNHITDKNDEVRVPVRESMALWRAARPRALPPLSRRSARWCGTTRGWSPRAVDVVGDAPEIPCGLYAAAGPCTRTGCLTDGGIACASSGTRHPPWTFRGAP